MKHHYLFKPQLTLVWWLLILLFSRVPTGYAQSRIYYAVSDGSLNSFNDQLRSIPLNGGGESFVYSNNGGTNFPASLAQIAYDAVGDRIFVANIVATSPALYVVSTSGTSSLFATISPIASSTATVVTGIVVDNVGGYVYYNVSDNNFRTSSDQLRRIPLAGGSEEIVVNSNTTNFPLTPQTLVIDRQNNRLLVANGVSSSVAGVESNNLYVSAVDLSTRAVTKAFAFAPISSNGATISTTQGGLAINTAENSLYYILRDNGIGTFNDQLRRIPLSGGPEQIVVDVNSNTRGFPTAPGSLAYDAVNNRILVNDISINNRDIAAVTPAGNITLLLDNGAQIGTANTGIVGLAVGTAQAPTTVTSITLNGTSLTNASTVQFTVTFASSVAGITTSNFATSPGSGITGSSIASVSGSGTTYTVSVNTGSGSGTLGLTLANDNGLTPSISNEPFTGTSLYTIDKTVPTTTISSSAGGNGSTTGTSPIPFSITFSEVVSGFMQGDLTVGNGTVSGFSGSGSTYTFNVTPTSSGNAVTVNVAAGVAQDAANNGNTAASPFSITFQAPTITVAPASLPNGTQGTAYGQTLSASGGTAPYSYAITAGALPPGMSLNLSTGTISGTPTVNGTFYFTVTARDNSAGPGPYSGSRSYSLTIAPPPAVTVTSVTRLTPSPTAIAQVSYRVVFSGSVTGLTTLNFSLTTSGLDGAVVASVSGSGTTYIVAVNTGTGDGTLRLNVANTTGVSPTISNVPYTGGETYTITRSFAAAPTLRIQAAGRASNNGDVTAFVDVVQVLQSGTSTVVTNGLQNASFETNNVDPSGFKKTANGVVASPWTFTGQAGVSRNNSDFGSTAAEGDAVGLVQSAGDNNASISQNLAVPTGSYQVSFQAMQRNYTSKDQRLNVFLVQGGNTVFIGNIQPNGNNPPTYDTFTSASFNVTAPALTATVSTTSSSPTSTVPIPFAVNFSQSVGTTFTASDVTVSGGTLASGSFSGSGSGPYTFTVIPAGFGTVAVSLAANVALDANNTGNSASNSVSVQFQAPTITIAPATLPSGTQGSAYSQILTASGGTSPYTYAITAGALPAGLTLASNGTLSGTPVVNGSFTFTVRATDASTSPGPYTGSRSYTLTIATPPVTAAPVVLTPANGSRTNDSTPDYSGTAPANSTVMVYVDGSSIGTTSADASGNWRLTQPTALSQDNHTVYATAQSSGSTVSVNSNTNTFTVDTVAPTVSSVGVPANGTYRTGQTLPITVNMSELVTVTGAPQVGLTIGATTRQATYVSGSGTQALLFSYTVQAGDSDTDGIAVGALTLNGGTIRDGVGNDATLTLNTVPSTAGVLVDGVAPTVSSSDRQNPTGPLTNGTAVIFRVSFNEAVTGVNNGSFSLITTDGSVTGTIVSTQPVNNTSNSQYDVVVSEVQGNGTLRLDVNSSGSGITDLAGNPISGGFTSGQTFTIDQIRPTVTISSSAAPNAGTTRTSPIPFAVTFSESVTEFVAGDITLTNGTLSGFTGSGTTYTFIVTPLANGPVTVNIAANVAQDAAINGNTAANPYSISYLPLTLTGFAPLNSNVCVGSPLTFTATVSNADGPYSYTLTNGNGPVTGTGNGTAFSRTITAAGEGLQSFTLIVTDASQRVSASQSITVNPLPAVSITGLASAYCKDAATVTLVGSPAGGTFTIDGNQAAQFNPAVLPVGSHTVIYSYTNSSDCSQTTSQTVTVKEVPNAPVVATQSGQSTVAVDLNTGNVTLLISGCAGSINWTGPNNSAGTSNTISVPTTQAGTFVYRASCTVEGCTGPLATATVTVGARLTVLHRDVDNYADNNAIQPLLVLQNNSTGSLPLSRVTLRYYVTVEGGGTLGNLSMNYAQVGNQNVRLRYVALNPAQQGATGYVEYSFTEGAGSLATGADSGPIQSYFTKSDYGPLNELDDYSYNPVRNQLTGNLRITAYYDGALIAGVEPGSGVQVRAVRALTESKNGPDATQISTYLEVRNEGNVAINYSDLKARYYFTSDGNERLQVEVDEGNVSARLVKLPQPVNGADTYLELTFNQSGQLAPGTSTGTIRYRISKPDGGRFNQANDYSYQEQPQDRSQNSRVVVYAGNERLWGQEPSGSARVAYAEAGTELTIKVLGNPIQNDQVSVEVTGAEGQALQLQLLTPQGRVVNQQHVPSAEAIQQHQLSVAGQAGGLFLLQVSTATQSKTVKVIKAD